MQTQWQSLREQRNRSQDRGSMPARKTPFPVPRKNLLSLSLSFYPSLFLSFRATSNSRVSLFFGEKVVNSEIHCPRLFAERVVHGSCRESKADARWRDERVRVGSRASRATGAGLNERERRRRSVPPCRNAVPGGKREAAAKTRRSGGGGGAPVGGWSTLSERSFLVIQ